jgi:hypothetical protein
MTLPASGAISFNAINVELGVAGTTSASLNQASYRTLAGVPSGAITMSNFYSKSYRVALSSTFSANASNQTVALASLSGYVAGKSDITVTVNSGVYVYSTCIATPAITFTGGTTGDVVTLVNNGFIMGQGGQGGQSQTGGPAISLSYPVTINNTNASAYIGGGGGSGSGGYECYGCYCRFCYGGGGGAGGGKGGLLTQVATNSCGDVIPGGSIGSVGGTYSQGPNPYLVPHGGGGGRIFPGTGGCVGGGNLIGADRDQRGKGGGAGGGGGHKFTLYRTGNGGAGNAPGGNGGAGIGGAGGGGWGASGGTSVYGNFGTGGKAVALNGKSVTWTSGNTTRVYGSVS